MSVKTGEIYKSTENTNIKVIKQNSRSHALVEFECGTQKLVQISTLKRGEVRDKGVKKIANIGYIGFGVWSASHKTIYSRWTAMISRCYNIKDKDYKNYGALGIYVCEDWHNFQNYAKWFSENCKDESYKLDKDILIKNNKVYSPDTCCFVPVSLNSIFVDSHHGNLPYGVKKKNNRPGYEANIRKNGKRYYLGYFKTIEDAFAKYKEEKEKYVKDLANFYKDKLEPNVYNALMNFTVEITD